MRAKPSLRLEAVAHIEAKKREVRRAGGEFKGLDQVKAQVELTGPRFQSEEQGRWNKHQEAVRGDERHPLELGTDEADAPTFGERQAGATDGHKGRDTRKPHGIAVLTAITTACGANNSESAVESQKVAMVSSASAPAMGWITLVMAVPPLRRGGYATQTLGTATFWKRCGIATTDEG
jgi:hypothetical protein